MTKATREELERRVAERTRELTEANASLKQEIAERRTVEQALRETETRFRMLAENIPQVFWITTPKLDRILYASAAYEQIWGRPVEEMREDPMAWTRTLHPDDAQRLARELEEFRHGKYEVKYRIIRPDGEVRWILDRGFPVRDDAGRLIYMTGLAEDVTEKLKVEEALRMRELAAYLQAAREDERKRIAREIHDSLGQVLTGLKLRLSGLGKHVVDRPEQTREKLKDAERLIDETIRTVQKISTDLRPQILDIGLLEAIRWQSREFEKQTGLACTLDLPEDEPDWGQEHSTAMFRIFQESLTNVARHANAAGISVRVREDDGCVILEVVDDGQGIKPEQITNARSFGLLGMQERARLLGGELSIWGIEGRGTTVSVKMPRRAG